MTEAIIAICYLLVQHLPSVTELPSTKEGTQHGVDGAAESRCWHLGAGVGRQLDDFLRSTQQVLGLR